MTDREAKVRRHIYCLQQMMDEKCKELEIVRAPLDGSSIGPMGATWEMLSPTEQEQP